MTQQTEKSDECEYESCSKEPIYELAHTETTGPHSYMWLCQEHKDTERIHDPVNTKIMYRDF